MNSLMHDLAPRSVEGGESKPLGRQRIKDFIKHRKLGQLGIRAKTMAAVAVESRKEPLAGINRMHGVRNLMSMEGYILQAEANFLRGLLLKNEAIKKIGEIGFNGGHSSFVFLGARPDTEVTSFDIGEHDYVETAEQYVSTAFPGRLQLIRGDSKATVPQFATGLEQPDFDLLFIDGGHDIQTAKADIANFAHLARPGASVVVDDYLPHRHYGVGPSMAWDEAVSAGMVAQESIVEADGRAWAVGHYL
jgi:predicted O-methyltransferase YrrM